MMGNQTLNFTNNESVCGVRSRQLIHFKPVLDERYYGSNQRRVFRLSSPLMAVAVVGRLIHVSEIGQQTRLQAYAYE